MKKKVMLSIRGSQEYAEQEPEVIELVTEGILEQTENGWKLIYEESELTGLAGVTTTFDLVPGCITLSRTGPLNSQMVFQEGVVHDSLYQMEFGTMMIRVCANLVFFDITPDGGSIDLVYDIQIENSASGTVDYHLDIRGI